MLKGRGRGDEEGKHFNKIQIVRILKSLDNYNLCYLIHNGANHVTKYFKAPQKFLLKS